MAIGGAVGPLVGGLAVTVMGLRAIFIGGGVLILISATPVLTMVNESPKMARPSSRPPPMRALRAARAGTLTAIAILVGSQAMMQFSYGSSEQMVVLRLIQMDPASASTFTGLAFGAAGTATGLAAVLYSRLARRVGYRRLAIPAAVGMSVTVAATALVPNVQALLLSVACFGLAYGTLSPTLSSMIGLETPATVQATVYGVSASAIALGLGLGPLLAGALAAAAGIRSGLLMAALVLLGPVLLLSHWGREPGPMRPVPAKIVVEP